ncbi:MAG: hypothetical protein OXG44_00970 [Gammaproteobacteria bacterium]|nr:hypothetical protein [Gammaproteobacteria bacterium]
MWNRLLVVGFLGIAIGAAGFWLATDQGGATPLQPPSPGEAPDRSVDSPKSVSSVQRSLAQIVGNATDFQRNTALYALLADTGREEVEALLAEVEALPAAPHRYDAARVLYTRFAELDPEAAADHVAAANYHSSWVAAVFRAWAHADVDAAVDRAAVLDGDAKAIAAAAILELDLPEWQRQDVAERLDSEAALVAIATREALGGADKDFAAAWRTAVKAIDIPTEPGSLAEAQGFFHAFGQLGVLARRWATHDPVAAMAALTGMENPQMSLQAQAGVLQVWAADDPSAAIAWLSEQQGSRGGTRNWMTQMLMSGLMERGVHEAILALDTIPAHLQEEARVGLVNALQSFRDPSDVDFQIVLDWYGTLESSSRQLVGALANAYAEHDPEQAFAWARTLEGRAESAAIDPAVRRIARSDPALARRLIADIDASELRVDAARQFISTAGRNDPEGTLEWARSFPVDDDRPSLERHALTVWSRTAPSEAVHEVLSLRDAELRDEVAGSIAWSVMGNGQVELAEELFDAAESENARRQIATVLLRYYTNVAPDEDKADFYREIAPDRGSRNGRSFRWSR